MKIRVKVITNAKENKIIRYDGEWRIYTTAQPEKGKANKKIIDLLADQFCTAKSNIEVIAGRKSNHKIISIIQKSRDRKIPGSYVKNEKTFDDKNKKYISRVHSWER